MQKHAFIYIYSYIYKKMQKPCYNCGRKVGTQNIMGAAIIDAIKSGLGLISDLAEEFLSGFSTLFWDATANTGAGGLTTFGLFALVMLGISVSFAIVRLVLNIVRGNTGA